MQRILLEFTRAEQADDPYAFRLGTQQYLLRTAGGGVRAACLDWDDELLDDLDELRAAACEPAVIQRLGTRLSRFLAPTDFSHHERAIVRALQDGEPVCVTIRSAAAELYALPWELLTIAATGQHLGELPQVLVRYHWPETHTTPARDTQSEGGRVLFAWSAAGGTVPADEHRRVIERACVRGHHSFDIERDVLPDVTLEGIEQTLAAAAESEQPVRVLHILAHGGAAGDSFGLVWDSEQRPQAIVDAARLRQLLGPYADQLRLVVLCACDSGNTGALGNHLGSLAQNLHRAGIAAVVASRLPLSVRGSIVFTRHLYSALIERPSSLEEAYVVARQALRRRDNLDWASLQLYTRPEDGDDTRPISFRPYRGLLPFERQHRRFFFGRDAECREILSDMSALEHDGRSRFLIVAGASGTGKSSMVMAGAVSMLVGEAATGDPSGSWRRGDSDGDGGGDADGDSDDSALGHLSDDLSDDLDDMGDGGGGARVTEEIEIAQLLRSLDRVEARLSDDEVRGNVALLRQHLTSTRDAEAAGWEIAIMRIGADPVRSFESALRQRRDPDRRFLLVIDQFEELFTSIADHDLRSRFVRRLWSICREPTGVCCIATIRVDFLGACGEITLDAAGLRLDQVAYDEAHRVFVAQMAPAQLREAIIEPARMVGLALEPGLASTMLEDVGTEPGALPLLQYTLDLLWTQRRGRELTIDAYHDIGGVTGALQRKADTLVDSLDAVELKQARRVLVRLVGADGEVALDTRKRVEIAALRPADEGERVAFERVLDALVAARLLVRSDDGGAPFIEVAHEALIRKWPRLRAWLSEDRDMLAEMQEVERWVAQWRDYGTVLEGDRLGYAVRVQHKHPEMLERAAVEMIDASVAADQRRRARIRRNFRVTITGAIVTTLFAAVAVWLALLARHEHETAERARAVAEQAQTDAEKARDGAEEAREQAQAEAEVAKRERDEAESAQQHVAELHERTQLALEAAEKEQEALEARYQEALRAQQQLALERDALKARLQRQQRAGR